MCNACGFPARAGHWMEAGLSTPHDRLRARFRRASLLARALRPYGLTAHDDGITDGITISTLAGASEIVTNPADLWPVAERLAGRPIDLLASSSLLKYSHGGGSFADARVPGGVKPPVQRQPKDQPCP